MIRRLRQHFWLLVLDGVCLVPGGFGSRAFDWVLTRASNATDWGVCPDCQPDEGKDPF